MKKITLMAALFAGAVTFAQTTIIDRPADHGSGLISVQGDDFGVYAADYFVLDNTTTLGEFSFTGFGTGNLPIGANVDSFNVYVFGHNGNKPLGSPIDSGSAFLVLSEIDTDDFVLFEEGNSIFTVDVTQANGGTAVTLPAGQYWVSAFPTVFGSAAGAGRWNWQGSTTPVEFPAMLIDPDDAFGAGATDWTLIGDDLVEGPWPSFGWTLTGEDVVSVGDNLAEQVSVYPNPTTDILNVSVPSSVEVSRVSMFDVLGKNVGVSYTNGVINTSSLAKGVYILSIETTSGNLTQKIVKQ